MKVTNSLNNILSSGVKLECLRYLCNYPAEINGRQLSKLLKITPKSIHKAMSDLVDEGVVNLNSHGNSFGYSMNKNKWVTKHLLLPLFRNEKIFLEKIIDAIRIEIKTSPVKRNILSVVLFGSVYESKDNSHSDFDILILVDKENFASKAEEYFEEVGTKLLKIFGITLGLYVKSVSTLKKDKSLPVIKSILSSHRLIYGQELANYVR